MEENKKTFFRVCPIKGCRQISGFWLSNKAIQKDEKFFCHKCRKESTLSKWGDSSEEAYLDWIKRDKEYKEKLKLQNSRMTRLIPAPERNYGRK